MTFWVVDWLRAFALTVAVELAVAMPLLARVETSRPRRAAFVALANLATHPLVWFAFPGLTFGPAARLACAELWALVAEAAIYRLVWPDARLRRAALVALAANAASFTAGQLVAHFARR